MRAILYNHLCVYTKMYYRWKDSYLLAMAFESISNIYIGKSEIGLQLDRFLIFFVDKSDDELLLRI